jgi:integrase
VTLNGRDVYLGKHGTEASRARYDEVIAEWLANGRKPAKGPADITIVELIRDYVRYAEGYYIKRGKPTTQVNLTKRVMKDLRLAHGSERAADFGPLKLEKLRAQWVARGLVRRTCNTNASVVKRMFRWAITRELVPPGIYEALHLLPELAPGRTSAPDRPPIGPVADEHVAAVLPHVSPPLATVIRLMDLTGMRPSEALCMRPCDLDRSGPVWRYNVSPDVFKSTHMKKLRFVLIGPRAVEILRPWLDRQPKASGYIFRAVGARGGRPGLHYGVNGLECAIKRACKIAGIPHWHPNQLRHNAATRLRKQVDMDTVRAVLGHSSVKMTEIYAEMDIDKARAIMEAVG